MKEKFIFQIRNLLLSTLLLPLICSTQQKKNAAPKEPKIVNIVNFIRDIEPREADVTKDVLYETVVKQIELMNRYP